MNDLRDFDSDPFAVVSSSFDLQTFRYLSKYFSLSFLRLSALAMCCIIIAHDIASLLLHIER